VTLRKWYYCNTVSEIDHELRARYYRWSLSNQRSSILWAITIIGFFSLQKRHVKYFAYIFFCIQQWSIRKTKVPRRETCCGAVYTVMRVWTTIVHPHDSLIKSRGICTNNTEKKLKIKYNEPGIKVFNTNFYTFHRDRYIYNKLTKPIDNGASYGVPESGDNIVVMYWVSSCKSYVFDIINNICII